MPVQLAKPQSGVHYHFASRLCLNRETCTRFRSASACRFHSQQQTRIILAFKAFGRPARTSSHHSSRRRRLRLVQGKGEASRALRWPAATGPPSPPISSTLVSGRLASEHDLLHVRQVCSHWRSSTSLPVAPFRPWVVATRAKPIRVGPIGEYSLWLPRGVRRVQVPTPPPGLPYCCGTPRGWLALADDEQSRKRLVLWDPHSGAEIPLPPLPRLIQVFLSADPLASPPLDWIAVATQVRNGNDLFFDHNIFFWRPGDAAWVAAADVYTSQRLHSVAFLGTKMYCMDFLKKIAVYDLNLGTTGTSTSPPVLGYRNYIAPLLTMLCNRRCGRRLHGARAAHFVACNGEVLLVVLFRPDHPSFAEVYKLPDLTPGRRMEEFGERVTDLRGYSIFLGRGDAFALSAEEFSGIRRNCVYYAVHYLNVHMKDWVFVFDLESDVLDEYPFPPEHKEDTANEWWPVSWFCPRRPVFLKQQQG